MAAFHPASRALSVMKDRWAIGRRQSSTFLRRRLYETEIYKRNLIRYACYDKPLAFSSVKSCWCRECKKYRHAEKKYWRMRNEASTAQTDADRWYLVQRIKRNPPPTRHPFIISQVRGSRGIKTTDHVAGIPNWKGSLRFQSSQLGTSIILISKTLLITGVDRVWQTFNAYRSSTSQPTRRLAGIPVS